MKLKNVLIVVKDIERSKKFYRDLFGLEMVLDNDGTGKRSLGEISSRRTMPANFILRNLILRVLSTGSKSIFRK